MPTPEESQIINLAVQRGLITKRNLDTILQSQAEGEKKGIYRPIIQILVDKKYITSSQLESLLEENKKKLQEENSEFIDKEVCGCVLKSIIGSGALGTTYVALHSEYNTVVVKVLKGIKEQNRDYVDRFLCQLSEGAFPEHANVAKLHEIRIEEQFPVIIREFINGESLLDRLQKGPLSLLQATSVILAASLGLAVIHKVGIVHKNFKPSNILICADETVKVADISLPPSNPHYLSPEQCQGKKSDYRSDIYSLGVVYYQAIVGTPPFNAPTSAKLMEMQVNAEPPNVSSQIPGIPSKVDKIIQTMLAKRRSDRYQSAEEVSLALKELMPEIGAKKIAGVKTRPLKVPVENKEFPIHSDSVPTEHIQLSNTKSKAVDVVAANKNPQTAEEKIKLQEYEIIEKIGKGAMGAVFKARSNNDNALVAIKVIVPELTKSDEFTQRFLREMQTILCLNHPNIAKALDCGVDLENDLYFAVMEFVEGESLGKLLERERYLPLFKALDFTKQVARGLQHAYEKGIVHRDIKPENILLTADNMAKIVDFGLSKSSRDNAALTQKGEILGTPFYIAPEQALGGEKEDIRADIYSLGITFYHMLAGRPPFIEGSSLQIIVAHTVKQIPPITEFVPNIPSEVIHILNKMIEKDPNLRFNTPAEVVTAIEEFESKDQAEVMY